MDRKIMKTILLILAACASTSIGQTASPTPIPCSDVKDASNPLDVVLIGEVHVGRLADAIRLYPALAAKLNAAAAKFAKDKEVRLIEVSKTNAPRAKQKLDEYLAAGIPISQATQAAILAALPPPMRPQPSPSPTPDDGL